MFQLRTIFLLIFIFAKIKSVARFACHSKGNLDKQKKLNARAASPFPNTQSFFFFVFIVFDI